MTILLHDRIQRTGRWLFFLFLIADLFLIMAGKNDLRWMTKPGIVAVLLAVLLLSKKNVKTRYRWPWILALLFSLAGDVFLMFSSEGAFLGGLASFLLAHLAYIGLFVQLSAFAEGSRKNIIVAFLLTGAAFVLFYALIVRHSGEMYAAVLCYSVVILVMWMTAFIKSCQVRPLNRLLMTGAALFVISDAILGYNLFVSSGLMLSLLVMLTYGLAQYCIFYGLYGRDPRVLVNRSSPEMFQDSR